MNVELINWTLFILFTLLFGYWLAKTTHGGKPKSTIPDGEYSVMVVGYGGGLKVLFLAVPGLKPLTEPMEAWTFYLIDFGRRGITCNWDTKKGLDEATTLEVSTVDTRLSPDHKILKFS